jgi:hypothetical protein
MSTVNPNSAGLTSLLQTLSAASPVLSTALAAPNVQSALAGASSQDIVELSEDAVQLQQVGVLFGNTGGAPSTGFNAPSSSLFSSLEPGVNNAASYSLLQALDESFTEAPGAPTSGTAASTASGTAASTGTNAPLQGLEALFGSTPTVNSYVNTLA